MHNIEISIPFFVKTLTRPCQLDNRPKNNYLNSEMTLGTRGKMVYPIEPKPDSPEISIIIPAYNEEKGIVSVLKRIV